MHVLHHSSSRRWTTAAAAAVALLPLLCVNPPSSATILPAPGVRVVTVIKDTKVQELSSLVSRLH